MINSWRMCELEGYWGKAFITYMWLLNMKLCLATESRYLENGRAFKISKLQGKIVKNGFPHTHIPILPQKLLSSPAKTSFVRCWIRIYLLETSKSYSHLNNTYHFQTRLSYINLHHSDVFLVDYEYILYLVTVPRLLIWIDNFRVGIHAQNKPFVNITRGILTRITTALPYSLKWHKKETILYCEGDISPFPWRGICFRRTT